MPRLRLRRLLPLIPVVAMGALGFVAYRHPEVRFLGQTIACSDVGYPIPDCDNAPAGKQCAGLGACCRGGIVTVGAVSCAPDTECNWNTNGWYTGDDPAWFYLNDGKRLEDNQDPLLFGGDGVCVPCLPGEVWDATTRRCVAGCRTHADCDDSNACTDDTCYAGTCFNKPKNCNDGNACTVDVCVGGACQHPPANCDDGDSCTDDSCQAATGCKHDLVTSDVQCICRDPDNQVICGDGVPQTPEECMANPANDACNSVDPTAGVICCAPGACSTASNGAAICRRDSDDDDGGAGGDNAGIGGTGGAGTGGDAAGAGGDGGSSDDNASTSRDASASASLSTSGGSSGGSGGSSQQPSLGSSASKLSQGGSSGPSSGPGSGSSSSRPSSGGGSSGSRQSQSQSFSVSLSRSSVSVSTGQSSGGSSNLSQSTSFSLSFGFSSGGSVGPSSPGGSSIGTSLSFSAFSQSVSTSFSFSFSVSQSFGFSSRNDSASSGGSSALSSVSFSFSGSPLSSASFSPTGLAFCGDGIVQASLGEDCDDGSLNRPPGTPGAGCSCPPGGSCVAGVSGLTWIAGCRWPRCGDGIVNNEMTLNGLPVNYDLLHEECDAGAANANLPDRCRSGCRLQRCGDGITDSAEECDDGNLLNGDGCSAACIEETILIAGLPVCGNGLVEPGEVCDDGNLLAGDGCSPLCLFEGSCTLDTDCLAGICENGVCIPGCHEDSQCPGGVCAGGSCVPCRSGAQCASGQCVDNRCTPGCTDDAHCANGAVCTNGSCQPCTANHECRSGICLGGRCTEVTLAPASSPVTGSRASTAVLAAACGNGLFETGEECDDRNLRDLDGCSSVCQLESGFCGDGVLQRALDEQCESLLHDPVLPYSCNPATCRFLSRSCGDGRIDLGEECDAGPANADTPNAACRRDCSRPRCGDRIIDPPETCDDGNRIDADGCSRQCIRDTSAAQTIAFPGGTSSAPGPGVLPWMTVPQVPMVTTPWGLPYAQVQPLSSSRPPSGDTGPAAILLMASGAGAGLAWMRRKRR